MQMTVPYILISGLMFALVSVFVAFRMRPAKPSRRGLAMAILPPLVMLVLFYSLAIHIHCHFGKWPAGMGDRDFPPSLVFHEHLSDFSFMGLLLFSAYVWPLAYVTCAVVRRWRAALYYLGIYALTFLVCFGTTLLAPGSFWDWWLD